MALKTSSQSRMATGEIVTGNYFKTLGVGAADPVAWAAAMAVVLGVSVLANVVPARRASRVDPMVALRHE